MKKTLIALAVVSSVFVAATTQAAISFNFANNVGADVKFGPGDQFQFDPAQATQWHITSEVSANHLVGLQGGFVGSPFSYVVPSSTSKTATVITPAIIQVLDGTGGVLTGNLDFGTMFLGRSIGSFNANMTVNVTGLSYAYTGVPNADLLALDLADSAKLNVTFQFSQKVTWANLASGNLFPSSFSGSLTAVPETSTAVAGFGALGLVVILAVAGKRTSGVIRIQKQN